tara:strand:+ start:638 stop:1024 length:387 start_codon:yes stop_codon:yes gene_type:complete
MGNKVINTAELEIVIKQCYRKVETHKLESHLYTMFDTKKHEDSRFIAEELLGCIDEYLYSPEELVVNLDFKRGMNELNYWCIRLTKRLGKREGSDSKIATELLCDLIDNINTCEMKMNGNLSNLGLIA